MSREENCINYAVNEAERQFKINIIVDHNPVGFCCNLIVQFIFITEPYRISFPYSSIESPVMVKEELFKFISKEWNKLIINE